MLNSHCLNLGDQGLLLQQMMINKAILLFRKYISDSDIFFLCIGQLGDKLVVSFHLVWLTTFVVTLSLKNILYGTNVSIAGRGPGDPFMV